MGIPGLTSFVDEHPKLLTDHELHDVKVVIDGNNLYHFLYYYFSVSHQYGGDYDHYARSVRFFFETFQQCGITPIIVFDGGYEVDDRKLHTMLRRARERIHLAGFLSHAGRGRILPIMAYETFKMVLDEMGISHVTCDNEADNEIAALANAWGCAVLSNDSDFFVFDLSHGFILLDYLNLTIQSSGQKKKKSTKNEESIDGSQVPSYKYLKAQIYNLNNLLAYFPKMERRQIALFGTLLGNDYVPKKAFAAFHAGVKLSNHNVHMRSHHKKRSQFGGLLSWLESAGSFQESLRLFLSYIPSDKHDCLKSLMLRSVDSYTKFSTNLLDYFESDSNKSIADSTIKTYLGNELPSWFLSGARCGQLPVIFVNIARLHRVIFLSQVENMNTASTYTTVWQLRRLIYGMIFSVDRSCQNTTDVSHKKKADFVEEYDRKVKTQVRNCVEPVFELPSGKNVPSLEELPKLTMKERSSIFYDALSLGDDVPSFQCCDQVNFVIAVIIYWVKQSSTEITWIHIYSLLVCWLKISILDTYKFKKVESTGQSESNTKEGAEAGEGIHSTETTVRDTEVRNFTKIDSSHSDENSGTMEFSGTTSTLVMSKSGGETDIPSEMPPETVLCGGRHLRTLPDLQINEDYQAANKNLQKFLSPPHPTRLRPFDGSIIHAFSQFQACFLYIHYLNVLLQTPLPSINIAHVFNGTFLYSLSRELQNRQEPFLYVCELLGRKSALCTYFVQITELLHGIFPGETVKKRQQAGKKNRGKKSKKSDVEWTQPVRSSDDESEEESCLDGATEVKVKCKLANRFDTLAIDDVFSM